MRLTKCGHAPVKQTLGLGVRDQNEGKSGGFGCDISLTTVYIALNSSTTITVEGLTGIFSSKCQDHVIWFTKPIFYRKIDLTWF